MALTAARVKQVAQKGRYTDGGGTGLFLNVTGRGGKSWIQRISIDGRRCDVGLGSYPQISLAEARKIATRNKLTVLEGSDPLEERRERERKSAGVPTFRQATESYYELHKPNLKDGKHRTNWLQVLNRHAMPSLGPRKIDTITPADVLDVLLPIWTIRPPTARRVRQRIRSIMAHYVARGIVAVNPAGESIDGGLPKQAPSRNHFRALPYQEVGEALETIKQSTASESAELAIRFLVLTAARSVEVRGMVWEEVDLWGALWIIPGERMKTGEPHRVPLSTQALDVLERAKRLGDGLSYVFPSVQAKGKAMSDMTLTEVLRRTGLADRATVHGFRTSFRTWAAEQSGASWAACEAALSHRLGNIVEQAYVRTDMLDERRELMQDWADFVTHVQN